MKSFEVYPLLRSRVQELYTLRPLVHTEPDYQRQSELWEVARKQLFIDSLVNGFDVPKLYFHELHNDTHFRYAVIDGKQRLEAVWEFMDGRYSLSDEFEFIESPDWRVGGLTYAQLAAEYPVIAGRLENAHLPIMVVNTTDIEVIEEMFSRLNEATPLNAPEKRNAFGGPLPRRIRELASHPFFTTRVPFANNRYRHLDLATKFLYLEYRGGVADTKKRLLDEFVLEFRRHRRANEAEQLLEEATAVLERMSYVFNHGDPLLTSVGTIVVYYLLFRNSILDSGSPGFDREMFEAFEARRQENKALSKEIQTLAREGKPIPKRLQQRIDTQLLQYDRYMQSVNDSGAIRYKCETILTYAEHWQA